jgi:hypothetical protein
VRDAVGRVDDRADLGRRGARGLVGGDEVLQRVTDDVGADGEICHGVPSVLASEALAQVVDSGGDGAVDDVVADLHAQAAEDGGSTTTFR